ncbi:MAG: HAD family phosphatase [Clostridia bacterium]|nr:HAD family phosphatase [Clostridia bacterium]
MIKNIIFDMGNVLLDYNPDAAMQMLGINEKAKPVILKELFGGNEWVQLDLGNISIDEAFESIKQRVPEEYHTDLRKCIDEWDVCMVPVEGAKEFCDYVKANGYNAYVLSNAHKSFYRYFPRYFDLDFFDGVVVSADVHTVKPDIKIYKHLLEKYSLKAEECLFIDDRADNVKGAIKAGMRAHQFKNDFEEIKQYIKHQ